MEYQHLVFEEFARKVQPAVRPVPRATPPDINAAVDAEFAHAVYRFGHSMLDRHGRPDASAPDGSQSDNSLPLLTAFAGRSSTGNAAGDPHARGGSRQHRDGFVRPGRQRTRRVRYRHSAQQPAGSPPRPGDAQHDPCPQRGRPVAEQRPPPDSSRRTNDGQLTPYTSWVDFGQHIKHPESLVNFVAAYGLHPTSSPRRPRRASVPRPS